MAAADDIRAAFLRQAEWCTRLDAPFTARLCQLLADSLDPATPIGARVLGWSGDPDKDALALRLCGGLHALVRSGAAPALAPHYPPAAPAASTLKQSIGRTLVDQGAALLPWLERSPQTNEVGRSAVLMSGLLVIAERFRLPMALYELGASAGLNLQPDRYHYQLGEMQIGEAAAALRLNPDWRGRSPPNVPVRITSRVGIDLDPVDPVSGRERLLAYVWPEQQGRASQLEAALDIAAQDPPPVAKGDAADWIESVLELRGASGVCRVVLHSVAFQYFAPEAQRRVTARLEDAGAIATDRAPLAWLRFEKQNDEEQFSLRLQTWPGSDQLIAWAHPHGRWIEWLDAIASAPARR